MLAKHKRDSIETLISQALIDMEVSHEELNAIINEKQKYERMRENVRNASEKEENMKLNSVNSRKITSLWTRDWLKITKHFTKLYFIFCIYIMYLISAEWYKNAGVHILIIKNLAKLGQAFKMYKIVWVLKTCLI